MFMENKCVAPARSALGTVAVDWSGRGCAHAPFVGCEQVISRYPSRVTATNCLSNRRLLPLGLGVGLDNYISNNLPFHALRVIILFVPCVVFFRSWWLPLPLVR